jgi:hypothetical protein
MATCCSLAHACQLGGGLTGLLNLWRARIERLMPLAAQADHRGLAHRAERCLDNLLLPLVHRRQLLVKLPVKPISPVCKPVIS